MRRNVRQVDWVRLIPVVLILVALIAINIYRRTGKSEPQAVGVRYTSYSTERRGARALYLLLGKLGYEPKRLRSPRFGGIRADGLAVILAPDRLSISETETKQLLEWVKQGNTLLFAPGRFDERLTKSLGVKLHQRPARKASVPSVASTELTAGVEGVSVLSGDRILTKRNDVVRHFGDRAGAVVASIPEGEGTAIVVSDPYIMTNAGLPEAGNLDLLVNILLSHATDAKTVYFDEYHHGFKRRPSVLHLLRGTSLGWALLQVALAAILLMISRARRFGQPKPVLRESHRSSLEYVTSLAGIYQSARAPDQALASLYNRLTYSVRGRPSSASVRAVMDECSLKMSGGNISERELIDLSRRMEMARRPKGGK
jgi:hypothetical protein